MEKSYHKKTFPVGHPLAPKGQIHIKEWDGEGEIIKNIKTDLKGRPLEG